jgi:hypothetical protein
MAKHSEEVEAQAAARERGEAPPQQHSPSDNWTPLGASKQREHVKHGENRHEHSKARGKNKT